MDVDKELRDLKRRVDLAETRLSQLGGQFGFITGQLRDIQLYLHARFDDIDAKIEGLEAKFGGLDAKFGGLEAKFEGLRTELPDLVATAVGSVIRGRG
jgi:hypothetical protein